MSRAVNLKPALAVVTAAVVAATGLPTGASAAPTYSAADVTVTRDSDLHVVPGEFGHIGFTLQPPKAAKHGRLGFSLPLTGLPQGFQILSMKHGLTEDCEVDQVALRARCTNVEVFETGLGIVTLTVSVAAQAPRDLDWVDVPVTISTATGSAVSVQDFASTRPCDDPPVPPGPRAPNKAVLTLEPGRSDHYSRASGRRLPICASLAGPAPGAKATVEFQPVGSSTWTELRVVTSDEYYSYFCTELRQRINGKARIRFDGDADYPAASLEKALPVVAAGLTGWAPSGTSRLGQTITMTPTVVPSPRKVLLQWRTTAQSKWKTAQTVTSSANGRITLKFKPPAKGKYWLRAYPLGDAKAGAADTYVRAQQVN
ncbi:hypothetical protein [Actinoplanes sp. NPDC051859]|uniref:hypothetical protein n=1 Tax=Actinoplanes sp. NPDC051859 TaxID=3363909 RepID=UPI003799608A